ncbi:MAG: NAD(P)-binding domain-containing protein [Clostridia bacterium]|nr:NAD(P)-binding domain-containing protein [Clostridia bacterium]
MTENNVLLIGGDLRQLHAGNELTKQGYKIYHYALDTYKESCELSNTLQNADAILLPIPVFRGDYMNFPLSSVKLSPRVLASEIAKNAKPGAVVFGGKFPTDMTAIFDKNEIKYHDLCENETFNYLNAVPTAEGAIALAMGNTPVTIDGSKCLVLGYGRIGKALSRRLKALGASVTVAARKERDRAEADSEGMMPLDYSSLSPVMEELDAVFNTVPTTVLNEEMLSKLRDGVPVIELASKPGGIDPVGAIRHGTRVISAQSLPGRVAPVTAGKIIARCIEDKMSGGEI